VNELLWLVLGAVIGGFVQGLSGFAFSMVAMSIWVWGVEPRTAAMMAVFGGLCGQLLSALTVRRGLSWQVLMPMLAGGLVGVPIGVWLLPGLNPEAFKLVLGSVLAVACPCMLLARRLPRIDAGRSADGLVGLGGGVLGGIAGFTGVLPTLWCTLRGFDKDLQRTTIQNFNLATLAATMAGYLLTGAVAPEMWPKFAIVAPALVLPSLLGARLYVGLSEAVFRRIVLLLLSASGAAMVLSSLGAVWR
jgi:uncharacterized membrane protein YfcA